MKIFFIQRERTGIIYDTILSFVIVANDYWEVIKIAKENSWDEGEKSWHDGNIIEELGKYSGEKTESFIVQKNSLHS